MSLKCVALVLGIFLLAFSASLNAAEQGFLEGHLKIIFRMAAQPSDDMPRPEIAPESYAEYPMVVLSRRTTKKSRDLLRMNMETITSRCRRALMFGCSRSCGQACSYQAATLHCCLESNRPCRYERRDRTWLSLTRLHSRRSIARHPLQNTIPVNEDRNIDTGIR